MSNYFYRGEMAPLADKVSGNEDKSTKVSPYLLTISYDASGEFHTQITVQRRDYFFRALTIPALRNQIKQTFPNLRVSFTLGRSAQLASDPSTILRG
jgi:hypothetical protein